MPWACYQVLVDSTNAAGVHIAFIVHICSQEVPHTSSKLSYACATFKENIKINEAVAYEKGCLG